MISLNSQSKMMTKVEMALGEVGLETLRFGEYNMLKFPIYDYFFNCIPTKKKMNFFTF